jgi:ABC-type transporter Mla MlaB component
MLFARCQPISLKVNRLAHRDACRVYDRAVNLPQPGTIVLDLSSVEEATTSAFARLVLLRRELLRRGRDLRLKGLRSRAAKLYEISRLETVLPRA